MKRNNKQAALFLCAFLIFLGLTIYTGIVVIAEEQEVIIQKISIVYDDKSGITVDNNNIIFNDKNQQVKYKVLIKNTQNYDVQISDIKLSTPSEEFLDYKVETLDSDILKASSEKEIVFSLETTAIKGWGRNFSNQLTANISFEKYVKQEEIVPPASEKEKQPEVPATTIEELTAITNKIEEVTISNNTLNFTEEFPLAIGEKVAVWIYSEPIFLGYFDVIETNGAKQILGLDEALKKVEIETGEHNLVLATENEEVLGYITFYINEENDLSLEEIKEPGNGENNETIENNPQEDLKEENIYQDVENPNTGDKVIFIVLVFCTACTGLISITLYKNNVPRYATMIIILSSVITLTQAESIFKLPIDINVNFKSQNIMKKSYLGEETDNPIQHNFWQYRKKIKNIYIKNEVIKINEYVHRFDVTEEENDRVVAYLVNNKDNSSYYDLYLIGDGIIYPNQDMNYYFYNMVYLDSIDNLAGIDTSEVTSMRSLFEEAGYYSKIFTLDTSSIKTNNVTNMAHMFHGVGYNNPTFTLDVSDFNTSKVTKMNSMFFQTGYNSNSFTLDVSNFDTSNVTTMRSMFNQTGYNSSIIEIDVSGFDTSNMSEMIYMFYQTGYNNPTFTLDVSDFNTSKVTDMSGIFYQTGYNSKVLELDVSNFDTSKVTKMHSMFFQAGYSSTKFTLDVSNFDTSNVTTMRSMFNQTGYNSPIFSIDVSGFDTSKLTNMRYMFNQAGYSNPNFTLNVSDFDMSQVEDMSGAFYRTGYNSTKLKITLTISKPSIIWYDEVFTETGLNNGTQIKVNYTATTERIVEAMIATKTPLSNVIKGNLRTNVDELIIGSIVNINGETFNVIDIQDNTIKMLATYNLNSNYRQSKILNNVSFSDKYGWEFFPGPKEIDIQTWSTKPQLYINNYILYLKNEVGGTDVSGDLITIKELEKLGCSIPKDYGDVPAEERLCDQSQYRNWLINSQSWWTKSAFSHPTYGQNIWRMSDNVITYSKYSSNNSGIRPVITISKELLSNFGKE